MFLRTAIVYVRFFKKESLNIYSLEDQEQAIRDYASEYGYRILEVFREDNQPSKSFDRPAFRAMVNYVKENPWKVKFLIVTDRTRLSTQTTGMHELRQFLRKNGIKLISIVESMLKYASKPTKQGR